MANSIESRKWFNYLWVVIK